MDFYSKAKDVVAKARNHPSLFEISAKVHYNLIPPQATYPPTGNHKVHSSRLLMHTFSNIPVCFPKYILQKLFP